MSHPRTQIREYILAKLLAGNTNAATRVYDSKIDAEKGVFPSIGIYTPTTRTVDMTSQIPEYRKEITVEVQAIVQANDTFAKDLDDLCLQIENLLDYDYRLNRIVESNQPDETEVLFNDKGEQQLAMAKMTYKANYIAKQGDITSSLDKFNTFHGDIDAIDPTATGEPGPDGQIDASVHITGLNP